MESMQASPLHLAIQLGNDAIAKLLIDSGASLDVQDKRGVSYDDDATMG